MTLNLSIFAVIILILNLKGLLKSGLREKKYYFRNFPEINKKSK